MRRWSRVGRRLYLCWTGLLLEDGIVSKTLALALLTIPADGVGFVALDSPFATGQAASLGSTLDLLLMATARQHSLVAVLRW